MVKQEKHCTGGEFLLSLNTRTISGSSWCWHREWPASPRGGEGGLEDGFTPQPQEHKAEITQCALRKMKNKVQDSFFPMSLDSQAPLKNKEVHLSGSLSAAHDTLCGWLFILGLSDDPHGCFCGQVPRIGLFIFLTANSECRPVSRHPG